MNVKYTLSRSQSFFLATLGQIEIGFQDLQQTMTGLSIYVKKSNSPSVLKDYTSVTVSMARFETLMQEVLNAEITPETESEVLKGYRHDLRSAISTIMGFSELIQESLEEEGLKDGEGFSYAQDQCRFILPLIEKLRFEEKNFKLEESAENYKQYCAITYPGKILIIDDDPQKCQVLSRRLESVGHEVIVCPNGRSGLTFLAHQTVDLILLDMLMPGMDGFEVLLEIKKDERLVNIPVLIISSVADMSNVVRCIRAGADDYLPMPVDTTLLHARINSCLVKKVFRDREQEALKQLAETQERLSAAIESIDEGFALFNPLDHLISCNSQFKNMYPTVEKLGGVGFTFEEFLRANIQDGIYQFDRRAESHESSQDRIQQYLSYHQNPGRPHNIMLRSGKWLEVIENRTPEGGIVSVHKDISEGKRKEDQLKFLANHDPLTGLANRALFEYFLDHALARSQEKNQKIAVMFFDLDGFKQVNDTLGHDFGDQVLIYVAQKLKFTIRETDMVARIGGDEFAAVLVDVDSLKSTEEVAQRCLDAVGTSLTYQDKTATFGVSIGFALYPANAKNKIELLKMADSAMYAAKKAGKGTYRAA